MATKTQPMSKRAKRAHASTASSVPTYFDAVIKVVVGRQGGHEKENEREDNTPGEEDSNATDDDEATTATETEGQTSQPLVSTGNSDLASAEGQTLGQDEKIEPTSFWIHEKLICQRSVFFQRALNGPWKESEEKVVNLPEDDPEVFRAYLALIYSSQAHVLSIAHEVKKSQQLAYQRSFQLYILAEKLQDNESKNMIVDVLVSYMDNEDIIPTMEMIAMVYRSTPVSCPLRRLLIDFHTIYNVQLESNPESIRTVPKRFLFDLTHALGDYLSSKTKRNNLGDPEAYYSKDSTSTKGD